MIAIVRRGAIVASAIVLLVGAVLPTAHAARNSSRCWKGIVFAQHGKTALKLDLRLPDSPPPKGGYPLIVSIHGGAWLIGDRGKDQFLRSATERGYAFASIDYRLSGRAKFPAQLDDVRAAVRWLVDHAAEYQINTGRIGLTGASAGGHLALLAGMAGDVTIGQPGSIRAVCALYPPTDLVKIVPEKKRLRDDNLVARLLGSPVGKNPALARSASPTSYVSPACPAILLIHGDHDPIVPIDQSRMLHEALRSAGADSTLVICEGRGHAFAPQGKLLDRIFEFFDEKLEAR